MAQYFEHMYDQTHLTLPREMFIAQQLMSLVLRNASDIELTATNLSEVDWNI